jgi:phosphatidylinositol-bisphosphatase
VLTITSFLQNLGNLNILNHDFVIWAGDLNYRIQSDIPDETVFDKVESGSPDDIAWLAERDQLNITRREGLAFADFNEAPLNFFPTYKYQAGTHHYDRRAEKKVRSPAWCDRVLWRTAGEWSCHISIPFLLGLVMSSK